MRSHQTTGSSLQLPGENLSLPPGLTLSRRANPRRQQLTMSRRRQSLLPDAASTPVRHQPVQFLAMPQLDAIQRTQKILDMRLQTLQVRVVIIACKVKFCVMNYRKESKC